MDRYGIGTGSRRWPGGPRWFRRPPRLPRLRGRALLLLVALSVLGLIGVVGLAVWLGPSRAPRPGARTPADGAPVPDSTAASLAAAGIFTRMRPRAGDCMAPPRLGFRWLYRPDSTETPPSSDLRFRIHLNGPGGTPQRIVETSATEATLDLDDSFPLGECTWWIEAIRPGRASLRSQSQTFDLRP